MHIHKEIFLTHNEVCEAISQFILSNSEDHINVDPNTVIIKENNLGALEASVCFE